MLPGLITKTTKDARFHWETMFEPRVQITAVFSHDERFRYWLEFRWGDAPPLIVIMLNPSKADHLRLDPTAEGMIKRAKAWGYGGLIIVNLFAFRATDPKDMKAAADPIGPDNDAIIMVAMAHANKSGFPLLCGWGAHGHHLGRDLWLVDLAHDLDCPLAALGVTKDGAPGHPLYIPRETRAVTWRAPWLG